MRCGWADCLSWMYLSALLVGLGSVSAEAQYRVTMLDGRTVEMPVVSLDAVGNLTGDAQEPIISLTDVMQVEKVGVGIVVANTDAPAVTLMLNGRGRLVGSSIDFSERMFLLMSETVSPTQVPMTLVQAIVFRGDPLVDRELENRSTDRDTVVVQTPEGMKKVSGLFEGLHDGKVMLQFAGKSRTIGLEKVAAIVLADLRSESLGDTNATSATDPIAEVTLADGGRITGSLASIAGGKLTVALAGSNARADASRVVLDFESVRRIAFQSDRLAWLSDLEPLESEQQNSFAPQRPWQRDRSVLGNPLRLRTDGSSGEATVTKTKGIGTQSFSRITFPIADRFDQFRCLAGIDTETRGRGDCVMKVLGDGIELWSQRMRGSDAAVPLILDVKGMTRLTLIVEPGEQFDLGDHADWADAQLLVTEP